MTDLVTFQVWRGSQRVYKGVDVGGLVGGDVTITSATFVVPVGVETVGDAQIAERRAWHGFRCDVAGIFWVSVELELSDGQHFILGFYLYVVEPPG